MNHTRASLSAKYSGNTGSMTLVTVRPHGPTISGAFMLNIGSTQVKYYGN